jgi:tight adherence protein B
MATGLSLRSALQAWPAEVRDPEGAALDRLAGRLRLGDSITGALSAAPAALGADGEAVASALGLHARLGGDAVRSLEGLAADMDRRSELMAVARAASAGARLSGRLVAGLPLLLVPVLPVSRAALLDTAGIVLTLSGVVLALGGLVWIGRLVPRPPDADPAGRIATSVAAALRAGLPLQAALDAATERAPAGLEAAVRRSRSVVRLGASWPRALMSCGDQSLEHLGRVLARARTAGAPAADALEYFAELRQAELQAIFDARLRRAPVLMVVPLTLLVLPSFVLLGVAPFLRGLS